MLDTDYVYYCRLFSTVFVVLMTMGLIRWMPKNKRSGTRNV